jgi:PAS domain S-box-containing protein
MDQRPAYDTLLQWIDLLKKENRSLRQGERKYRTLFESAGDSIAIHDLEGRILEVNESMCRCLGYSREALLRITPWEIDSPEHAHKVAQRIQEVRRQGHAIFETVHRRYDGTEIPVEVSSRILEYEGKPAVLSVARDITRRKQAEQDLKEREGELRILFEEAVNPITVADEEGRYLEANNAALAFLECDLEELKGKTLWDFMPPEEIDRMKEERTPFFGRRTIETEYRVHGKSKTLMLNVIPLELPGKQRLYGIGQDITERKKTEEALRISEEKYRLVAENANEGIFIIQDEQYKFVNQYGIRLFESTREKILSSSVGEFNHPDDLEMILDRIRSRLAGRRLDDFVQHRIVDTRGNVKWVETRGALTMWEGRSATIAFALDITERKNLESQLRHAQKMEAVGTLAGGIAHDFNNILGIILGNIDLALEDVPEWNPARYNLEEVRKASLRAKDLVRQILSFSRKAEVEQKPLKMAPIVGECLTLLRSSIPTRIEIRKHLDARADTIRGDSTQIHQVLINLCANAAHAMGEKGGVLEVFLENESMEEARVVSSGELKTGSYLRLTVRDTGHGMEPRVLERIFDPYFTTKQPGEGTGMGLAVVHGIVKSHGGAILVESDPGRGSAFHLFFPVVEMQAAPEPPKPLPLAGGSERILVVDDEKSLAVLLKSILERLGYQAVAETSPVEALKDFQQEPGLFDLVITDMTMPQMTGSELVARLMEIRPDIPVILCTGYSEGIDEARAAGLGIRAFLLKPLMLRKLAETVRRVLDESGHGPGGPPETQLL